MAAAVMFEGNVPEDFDAFDVRAFVQYARDGTPFVDPAHAMFDCVYDGYQYFFHHVPGYSPPHAKGEPIFHRDTFEREPMQRRNWLDDVMNEAARPRPIVKRPTLLYAREPTSPPAWASAYEPILTPKDERRLTAIREYNNRPEPEPEPVFRTLPPGRAFATDLELAVAQAEIADIQNTEELQLFLEQVRPEDRIAFIEAAWQWLPPFSAGVELRRLRRCAEETTPISKREKSDGKR